MERIKQGTSIFELATPAVLLDLDVLERNIEDVGEGAKRSGKELWPMVKTHKSLEITRMQHDAGATGYLCGTIDEAEMLVDRGGLENIMLAYPVADAENLARCLRLLDRAHLIFRLDSEETALLLDRACEKAGRSADYVIKIDVGVRRFGVEPEKAPELAQSLQNYGNLHLIGIATHPGHVYASGSVEEVRERTLRALGSLQTAYKSLRSSGYDLKMIAVGSTPSFRYDVQDKLVTHVHPGNYVYYDAMQVALGTVPLERCALTVLVTVTSRNKDRNTAAINAGVKVFTRDIGGHDIEVVKGYGIVKGFPKATVKLLSEEVGLLDIKEEPGIKVGSKLQIVPNHACVVNNQTSHLVGHRNGTIQKVIRVDARVGI